MKRFLNSHIKCTTTAIVLIAWLFAVASGIVNACLLEGPRGTHSHTAGIEEASHSHAGTALATNITGHTEQSHSKNSVCLDACDDRSRALVKQDAFVDQPQLAPLTVVAIVWLATQSMDATVRLQRDDDEEPFDVPIRVRYSRLTL